MTPILGIMASQISGHLTKIGYQSIATISVTSSTSSVEFTSIPSGFKHLQIRVLSNTNRTTYGTDSVKLNLNSDTGSNYSMHWLRGNGATATGQGYATQTEIYLESISSTTVASNTFGVAVIDILDYTNTNKYKTVDCLSGVDINGTIATYGGFVYLTSGNWRNTNAVTSIKFTPDNNFQNYSSFALYGVS